MLSKTATAFTISGLEHLDKNKNYLFIGNHRDIVLDPALVNYALKICGYHTVRIAIGDNLQSKSFISDLMRLNKSFIVKRSIKGPREKVVALRHLSHYIHHWITVDRCNIWIAQGEGRAKDGRDITQPAIVKMLAMSKPKEMDFTEYINSLSIVPVAISYEIDPCDALKARERYIRASTGSYKKGDQEDFDSIAKGLMGNKGDIHLSFGDVIEGNYQNAEEVAQEIDRQIISQYKLQDFNRIAYNAINESKVFTEISQTKSASFQQRLSTLPVEHKPFMLEMYANIVSLRKEIRSSKGESDPIQSNN